MSPNRLMTTVHRMALSTLKELRLLFLRELAIDLGSANTRIYAPRRGLMLNEPSVLALRTRDDRVVAAGRTAKQIMGRAPDSIRLVRPIRKGMIADIDAASKMLGIFLQRALVRSILFSSRILFCIPAEITSIEQHAFEEVADRVGARQARFIEGAFAAAVGVGIETNAARASAIVDIGAETVDIAVVSLGGLIHVATWPTGGLAMDHAIARSLRENHSLEVGEQTAEFIKLSLGSALTPDDHRIAEAKGRSLQTRSPKQVPFTGADLQIALAPVVGEIAHLITNAFEFLTPEVASDLLETGVMLTGGAAQLSGLPERLSDLLGVEVSLATNPTLAPIVGAARILWPDSAASELESMIKPATTATAMRSN